MKFDYFDGEPSESCSGVPEIDFPELFSDFDYDEYNSFEYLESCEAYLIAYRKYSPIAKKVYSYYASFVKTEVED